MYRVYFMDKRGQGYIDVEAHTKEEAKVEAIGLLKRITVLTVERIEK